MAGIRSAPDVYMAGEVARAAGASPRDVQALVAAGAVEPLSSGFLSASEAVRAVNLLRQPATALLPRRLFAGPSGSQPRRGLPLAASGAIHAGLVGSLALLATLGVTAPPASPAARPDAVRLVFLSVPGPGGGGGGGGARRPPPPAPARQAGRDRLRSPVPVQAAVRRPAARLEQPRASPPPRPVERPADPPPQPPRPDPLPPVNAPVASVPADATTHPGVITEAAPDTGSRGPGEGGGSGTGTGTGAGEGEGSGIGPGSGGGTGGGPYRPGAGITPPSLMTEVKPDYTEEARRRSVEGEVVLEIIVRSDGSVGSMRLLQGLGAGLDERAMAAVRRWRFAPARRYGTPVDVLVEVAVEFRMR